MPARLTFAALALWAVALFFGAQPAPVLASPNIAVDARTGHSPPGISAEPKFFEPAIDVEPDLDPPDPTANAPLTAAPSRDPATRPLDPATVARSRHPIYRVRRSGQAHPSAP